MKPLAILLFFLAALGGLQAASSLSVDDIRAVGIEQKLGASVPRGLTFTNSEGTRVDFNALVARKPALLALVYYNCPNLCTVVLNGMVSSLDDLRRPAGDGFQVVVVSIDPTEKPALAAQKKAAYLLRYSHGKETANDWAFLTGDDANIRALAGAVGYHYRYDAALHQFAHGSGLVMLDPRGHVSQYFLGIEYPPAEIEKSIQQAQRGETGSLVDQFILLCYCYNPLVGPYGWMVFAALKIGASATVLGLGWYIVSQIRREGRVAA